MSPNDDSVTSVTLLGRVSARPTDEAAWDAFVKQYSPRITRWAQQWGLQPNDAQDLTQNVLLQLAQQMQRFVYQPTGRFRAWLKTVAYRAWADFLERRRRQETGSGDSAVLQLLASVEAKEAFLRDLEEEFDNELLRHAVKLVKERVDARTWEAYRLMTLERLSGADTAERLQIKVGTVFVAKSRVQQMLIDEVRRLEGDFES